MKRLTIQQTLFVSGGYTVTVEADVSPECARFMANTWEKHLNKALSYAETARMIYLSPFDTAEIEKAFAGIKVGI